MHGYPDWFKQLKKEKGNTSKAQVNLVNSLFEEGMMVEKKGNGTQLSHVLSDLVQREVSKLLKDEQCGNE